jgi:hypothetical protein
VNTPKIGSRDGGICFGGILGFHAELRRECFWRNLKLGFFDGLVGIPRGATEEGGTMLCIWGNLIGVTPCDRVGLWFGSLTARRNGYWRGVW